MGITEILRGICWFSANDAKSSRSFSKQPTQLIITAHNCHIWLLKSWVNLDKDVSNMFIYQVSQLRSMRVTRRIVLTLLTKALYKFGCFREKVWLFLKCWIWQRFYFTELPWDNFAWSFWTNCALFFILCSSSQASKNKG